MTDNSTKNVDVSAQIELLRYMQASNVNVSNFVSVKLSSQGNYHLWKAQMLCLIESQMMRGIIDAKYRMPGDMTVNIAKKYDNLLRGWIFGTLKEEVLENVVRFESARDVWKKLESFYDHVISSAEGLASPQLMMGTEIVTVTEIENIHNSPRNKNLYEATVNGHWWKAKAILNEHKDAATEPITENGNTMLHLAVGMSQNYFVEKLLHFIQDRKDLEKKNSNGRTALHIAAIVGNKHAAQLLVDKRKELLEIRDYKALLPLNSAYNNMKLNTYVYLLKATKTIQQSPNLDCYPDSYIRNAVKLLITAIFTKQYDLALTMVEIYPTLATRDNQILMAIAITFPPDLSPAEAFIYPSLNNFCNKTVERSSLLFNSADILNKGGEDILWAMRHAKNMYYSWLTEFVMILLVPIGILYPVYQLIRILILYVLFPFFMLYFLLWKVLAIVARPVKHIEKKKKEYKEAKHLLSVICDHIDSLKVSGTDQSCYNEALLEAVRQGTYEVVDEILFRSPNTINCTNQEGHNVIQLAIINRSEKVYNLIYHIIERSEDYRTMTDSSRNNLVHLVGRLAPSHVLSRTTGAALQLQRELQWHKEVEKLMLPTELIKENIYMETPNMVFTKQHEDLVKEGEQWMKTTAESCSITAALIVTIVFAAAITVPGGSNQETGIPVFEKEVAFVIFAVSDAISLFTAATALLVFLSILTTRFAEKDFLVSLPRRLIIGLCALFLSTAAMMVAFGAILYLVFGERRAWMLGPIGGLTCLPILVVVTLQFPLVLDLFQSTYSPRF
ncbi:ankyrin repeat-containing protein, partial [Tanacetum coccineum]